MHRSPVKKILVLAANPQDTDPQDTERSQADKTKDLPQSAIALPIIIQRQGFYG
jgi:hypothetical protein